jgi:hypothetical protein
MGLLRKCTEKPILSPNMGYTFSFISMLSSWFLFAEKITSTRWCLQISWCMSSIFFKRKFVISFHKELDTYFVLPTRMGLDCWWPNTLKKSGLLYTFSFSTNLYHLLFFSWHCDRREKLASLFSSHPPRHFKWDTYPSTKDAVPCILVILG